MKTKVGDVCDLVNGKAFKPADWSEAGTPIIRIQNLNDREKPFNYWAGSLGRQVKVATGDVLLAWSGTPGTSFGVHIWDRPPGILNQHIFRVDLDRSQITRRWFRYAVNSQLSKLIYQAHGGVGLQHVTRRMVDELEIQLPPLDEQRRIAAILDKADILRRQRKRALGLLDSLTWAIFAEMFGDLEINSKGWNRAPFDHAVSIDAPLVNPKKYSNHLHYGPDRIEKDTGRLLPAQTAQQDGLISNKFLCNNTHILYSKIRPYLNKVALCDAECLCSADVYPVSTNAQVAHRSYIWYLLRSKAFLKYAETCSNRANIPKINREQFLRYEAPIPPLALQQEFAQRVAVGHQAAENVKASNLAISSLFASLQQRAFSGQL